MNEKSIQGLLVDQNPTTPEKSTQINTPNWHQTETQTQTVQNSVVIKRNHPPRSVSTVGFEKNPSQVLFKGAPFPSHPSKQEVQAEKEKVEEEIRNIRGNLTSLQYERRNFNNSFRPMLISKSLNGIREYRGIVFTDNTIQSIIEENRVKVSRASTNFNIQNHPKFRQIYDLPFFMRNIQIQNDNIVPFFAIKHAELQIQAEKEEVLVSEYRTQHAIWKDKTKFLDEITERTFSRTDDWPLDFNSDNPKPTEDTRLKYTAPDVPMILNPNEKEMYCFIDYNSYVEDPVKEYQTFKNRVAWTEEEKQIFFDRYRQKNKKFGFIADELPNKTLKDVIEFYYLNRYRLNLKDNEGGVKRRGGKRKMITEGSKKKNF